MAEPEINAFLTHLAVKEKVSASTQNQALSALLFLYRYVHNKPLQEHLRKVKAIHERDLADGSRCRTPWTANTRTRPPTGAGSGFSPRRIGGRIENL